MNSQYGKKLSDYPKVDDFSQTDRESFIGSALIHAIGKKDGATNYSDGNLTLGNFIPDTTDASSGDVLTFDGSDIGWAAPQGGGGGSTITPVEITPTWDALNHVFSITVPSNNGYFIATLPDKGEFGVQVDILPPIVSSDEFLNVVVFVVMDWKVGNDHEMRVVDSPRYGNIKAMDEMSYYGQVHGNGFTRFDIQGKGYTMRTTAWYAG